MKNKLEINYILNNEEKTIKNKIQYLFRGNKLFFYSIYGYHSETYDIKKDVKLIHIKNAHFEDRVSFNCYNKDTILILENCTFECNEINIEKGHIELINCIFTEDKTNRISVWNPQDITIKGNENPSINILIIEYGKKVELDNIKMLRNLSLIDCEDIKIRNLTTEKHFLLEGKTKIEIEDSNFNYQENRVGIKTKHLKMHGVNITNKDIIISCEELNLENSQIKSNNIIEFEKDTKEIILDDNSYIEGTTIQIGDHKYQTKNEQPFRINKKMINNIWFQRKNLICILKEIKQFFSSKITEQFSKEQQEEIEELDKKTEQEIELIKKLSEIEKEKIKSRKREKLKEDLSNLKLKDI